MFPTTQIPTFLLLLYYFLLLTIYCNGSVNQPGGESESLIIEIKDIDNLKNFLKEKKKAIVEFFVPTCPHCIDFAPKYEILSNIYQDAITFAKVDSSEIRSFMGFVNIKSFPSLFIYDEGNFFQYDGLYEIEYIHQFIETNFYFKCHKLDNNEQLTNFINENSQFNYILGIFKSKEISDKELNTFIRINADMRRLVLNKCYYYIDDKHSMMKFDSEKFQFDSSLANFVTHLSNRENFIITFDSIKFNVFDQISSLHNLHKIDANNSYDKSYEKVYKKILQSYEKFLIHNFFPPWEYLEEDMLNTIIARNRKFMIFSALPKDKTMIKNLMEQFILMKPSTSDFDFTILFIELTEEKKKSKLADMIIKTEIIIYDTYYRQHFLFEEESMFNVDAIISIIEEKNKKSMESNEYYKIYNSHSDDSHSKYVTAKIVNNLNEDDHEEEIHTKENKNESNKISEKLEDDNNIINFDDSSSHESEAKIMKEKYLENVNHKNSNETYNINPPINSKESKGIFVWLIYIMVYTFIYVVLYKKYFTKPSQDEEKYN